MDPITILAALAPLGIDLGKGLIQKITGGEFKPTNVEDYIRMKQFDLDMFKAMNEAGGSNPSYPFVEHSSYYHVNLAQQYSPAKYNH